MFPQTCIAPDYILCSRQKQQMLVAEMVKYLKDWHGANPQDSKDWGRIINERHFDRIVEILKTTTATVAHGGTYNKSDLYINPTLLTNVDASKDTSMREEIFGPVLPFVTVNSAQEAVDFINEREKPLALYVFSDDKATQKLFTERTSSGGLVFNELLLHIGVESLPFGGVGESGMGAYHGDVSKT
jgi:acyl-CoA reductase-like NAD-dependent aldehyde dehydrogenase